MVKVHYTGWTTDGKMFDSSVVRGEPATFPLDKVIPGWTEGVQLIGLGGTTRIWVPEELAYKGKPGRPKGMLVFDVQLLEITSPPTPPKDLKAPPANAERTATGVASRVLEAGTGRDHPTAQDVVIVHYTGWTTDGQMFDSSVQRGRPISFPLRGVIHTAGVLDDALLLRERFRTFANHHHVPRSIHDRAGQGNRVLHPMQALSLIHI